MAGVDAAGGGVRHYVLLHGLLFLYSVYALLMKFAAAERFLSGPFMALYAGALLVMLVYALLWQVVLKRLPLSVAFSNKAVVIVWGMLWGALFFSEAVTWPKLLGAAMVVAGICVVVQDER
jgi:drug/metabolite transporter (DMT)-like permease